MTTSASPAASPTSPAAPARRPLVGVLPRDEARANGNGRGFRRHGGLRSGVGIDTHDCGRREIFRFAIDATGFFVSGAATFVFRAHALHFEKLFPLQAIRFEPAFVKLLGGSGGAGTHFLVGKNFRRNIGKSIGFLGSHRRFSFF